MALFSKGSNPQLTLAQLLLAASILHLTVALGIFLIGRFGVFPNTFDAHGIGISFAIDSKSYRVEAADLADRLQKREFSKWNSHPRLHVKLYSLYFFALKRFVGANILSAEPLNLSCFLLILMLIHRLGTEIFEEKVGLMAAGTVALWPSFLLHSTQMLRDPLFIIALLSVILIFTMLLTRTLSLKRGVVAGVAGSMACFSLWIIRGDWWELIFVVLLLSLAAVLLNQVLQRRLLIGNALAAVLIIGAAWVLPQTVPAHRHPDRLPPKGATTAATPSTGGIRVIEGGNIFSRAPIRIGTLRHNFIVRYPKAGSNIDTNVELNGLGDLVRYLPRAMVIGLFSPFPNMWFSQGAQVGAAGRLLAGVETLALYVIQGLAIVCLFFQKRRLSVWLLVTIVLTATVALGYVVVNVSTIYRMRYGFAMLLIILGANGLLEILTRLRAQTPARIHERAGYVG